MTSSVISEDLRRRDGRRLGDEARLEFGDRSAKTRRAMRPPARPRTRRGDCLPRGGACQASRAGAPRAPARAPSRQAVGGNLEGRPGPAQLFARAGDFGRAERRAMRRFACPPWSARRSRSWSGRRSSSVGLRLGLPSARRGSARGRGRRCAIVCQPRASKRLRWSVEVDDRGRAIDRDMVVVPHHDQLSSFRWPARSMASWLTPSIRQPSPAIT